MDKKRLTTIVTIVIVTTLIIIGVIVFITSHNKSSSTQTNTTYNKTITDRTADQLMQVLLTNRPDLKDEQGKSTVRFTEPPERLNNNWYVIRIMPVAYDYDTAKVLLYDPGQDINSIKLIIGPGTDFPDDAFNKIVPAVPDIVKSEMNR